VEILEVARWSSSSERQRGTYRDHHSQGKNVYICIGGFDTAQEHRLLNHRCNMKENSMPLILYQKDFTLGEDVSFIDFLKALGKIYYVNYGIVFDKAPINGKCRFELVTHIPLGSRGLDNMVYGKVLLSEGEILYSKKSKHFTIRAWAKGWNLFNIWLFFIMAILGWIAILYLMYSKWGPTIDIFLGLGLMFLPLVPHFLVYRRDKDILNRIGSIGKSLEKS
jgi:hypothetical protein